MQEKTRRCARYLAAQGISELQSLITKVRMTRRDGYDAVELTMSFTLPPEQEQEGKEYSPMWHPV